MVDINTTAQAAVAVAPATVTISAKLYQVALYGFATMFSIMVLLLFYVIPYAGVVFNKWKLRFKGKNGYNPVYLKYKNNMIDEFIVDTKQATFVHKDKTYNVRTKAFHKIDGINVLFYEEDNPEPLTMTTDDEADIWLQDKDGIVRAKVKGKVVPTKQYNDTCEAYYYAGIAKERRKKGWVLVAIIILGCVTALGFAIVYAKTNQSANMCAAARIALQNATVIKEISSASVVL